MLNRKCWIYENDFLNQTRMCDKEVGKGLEYSKTNYLLHCHLVIFGLILSMFLQSKSYDFDAIAHAGAPLGVK